MTDQSTEIVVAGMLKNFRNELIALIEAHEIDKLLEIDSYTLGVFLMGVLKPVHDKLKPVHDKTKKPT